MRLFSFGNGSAGSVTALFDIGSGSVGGALVRLTHGGGAKILFATRVSVPLRRTLDADLLLEDVSEALSIAAGRIGHAAAASHTPVNSVSAVLSSPWYDARVSTIGFSGGTPRAITSELVQSILEKGTDAFEQAAAGQLHAGRRGPVLIERSVIQTRIDGHDVPALSGKTATNLDLTVYLSATSGKAVDAFTEALRAFFERQSISFHSFPLAAFLSLRDLFHTEDRFLIVHAGGEVTDVVAVQEGRLESIHSFPLGRNGALRSIERNLKAGEAESLTLMRFALEGAHHPLSAKDGVALRAARAAWVTHLTEALTPEKGAPLFAERAFLITDPDVLDWFGAALRSVESGGGTEAFLEVEPLSAERLLALPGNEEDDVALSLEAAALSRLMSASMSPENALIHKPARTSKKGRATMQRVEPDKKAMQDVFPSPSSSDRSIRNIKLDKEPRRSPSSFAATRGRFMPQAPQREDAMSGGTRHRYGLWALAAFASAAVLFLLFSVLFSGAKITVIPKTVSTPIDGTFVAQVNGDGSSSLPFQVMTITRDATKTVPAQGTETVNVAASGTIVVYNAYSTAPLKLITNTRFETPGGLIYRIHEAVTVPGKASSASTAAPGSLQVTVYADQPGETYNIAASDFTLPGLKNDPRYSKVYARSAAPMTGGFAGTRPKILDADVTAAENAMQTDLSAGLKADAGAQIPDGYLLYPDGQIISFDTVSSAAANASSATLTERGTLSAVIFPKDKLASFVGAQTHTVSGNLPLSLLSPENLSFSIIDKSSVKADSQQFSFTLSGTATVVWGFDEAQFKSDLAGKQKAALQTVLTGYPGIASATVSLRPFWKGSFPSNPKDITVEVAQAK